MLIFSRHLCLHVSLIAHRKKGSELLLLKKSAPTTSYGDADLLALRNNNITCDKYITRRIYYELLSPAQVKMLKVKLAWKQSHAMQM